MLLPVLPGTDAGIGAKSICEMFRRRKAKLFSDFRDREIG